MVIAPQTDENGTEVLGERLRSTVELTPACYDGKAIHLTVSIGFAVVGMGQQADYKELQHEAAKALAEAKNTGRNRVVVA